MVIELFQVVSNESANTPIFFHQLGLVVPALKDGGDESALRGEGRAEVSLDIEDRKCTHTGDHFVGAAVLIIGLMDADARQREVSVVRVTGKGMRIDSDAFTKDPRFKREGEEEEKEGPPHP